MKALREFAEHVAAHGLVRGTRLVWLKSKRRSAPVRISSPITGGQVWVRPGTSDMAIYDQIVLHPYLPKDRKYTTILDCGSNIGLSVRYLKTAYPSAKIVAVEPDSENFRMLLRNTTGSAGITCLQAGVWHTSGFLSLHTEGLGPSSFRTLPATAPSSIPAMTIPEIMRVGGVDRLSLLKIDIEGSEMELFSAADTSWIEQVDAISIELHDRWKPGCGDAFFKAIAPWSWTYSLHGENVLCEKR
jgi:FkbM family methyltransferase